MCRPSPSRRCTLTGRGSSESAPARFITAFPNGNTGTLIYFVPLNSGSGNSTGGGNGTLTNSSSSALGASLQDGTLQSYSGTDNQTGITGQMSISGDLQFGVTISQSGPDRHVEPRVNRAG